CRCPPRGRRRRGGRPDRLLQGALRRLQAAEAHPRDQDDPADRDRQGSTGRGRQNLHVEQVVRIAIAGAGAIGGCIGARLTKAGADVVLFARGPHLRAMQERCLRIESAAGSFEVKPRATGLLDDLRGADVVVLGVKAHGLTTLAPQLRPLFGPDTVVVSTQNGIPWWYFQDYPGELNGLHLERV